MDIHFSNDKNVYLGRMRSIETHISKIAVFTMINFFGAFFLVLSSVTNLREQFVRVHKLFWQIMLNLLERFLGPKRLFENTNLFKNVNLSSEKKYLTNFYHIIEFDKPQGTLHNTFLVERIGLLYLVILSRAELKQQFFSAAQCLQAIIMQVKRSFL